MHFNCQQSPSLVGALSSALGKSLLCGSHFQVGLALNNQQQQQQQRHRFLALPSPERVKRSPDPRQGWESVHWLELSVWLSVFPHESGYFASESADRNAPAQSQIIAHSES